MASWGQAEKKDSHSGSGKRCCPEQGEPGGYLPGRNPARSWGVFDVKLVDIDRVELLKGPQGTLYGSDAFSGVVRNVFLWQRQTCRSMEGKYKS